MKRRELLAAFLGLPMALAACRRNEAPSLPAGEIVGASDVFGHRLRDGMRVEVPQDAWSNVPLVIVGGGVAGLTAAWRLQNSGFKDFVLIELESAPGGTSRSGSNRLISFPWGAHYIPTPMKENAPLVSLLEEMGMVEGKDKNGEPVIGEQFLCRDPEERVFTKDAGTKDSISTPVKARKTNSNTGNSTLKWTSGLRGATEKAVEHSRCPCLHVRTTRK